QALGLVAGRRIIRNQTERSGVVPSDHRQPFEPDRLRVATQSEQQVRLAQVEHEISFEREIGLIETAAAKNLQAAYVIDALVDVKVIEVKSVLERLGSVEIFLERAERIPPVRKHIDFRFEDILDQLIPRTASEIDSEWKSVEIETERAIGVGMFGPAVCDQTGDNV